MTKLHCFVEVPHKKKEGRVDHDEVKKKFPDYFDLHDDFFHHFGSEHLPEITTGDPTLDESLFRLVVDPSEKDYDLMACYHGEVDEQDASRMEAHPDFIFWDSPSVAFAQNQGPMNHENWWRHAWTSMYHAGQGGCSNPGEWWRQWGQWMNPGGQGGQGGSPHPGEWAHRWHQSIGSSGSSGSSWSSGSSGQFTNPWGGGPQPAAGSQGDQSRGCQSNNPYFWWESMFGSSGADRKTTPCDCNTDYLGLLKGHIVDVARALQVDKLWQRGFDGEGVSIGLVDAGVTAEGRPWPWYLYECSYPVSIPNVVNGFPESDWGTMAGVYGHALMTGSTALSMAPKASLYDIRISADCNGFTKNLKDPHKAYSWIYDNMHKKGFPKVLSNQWVLWRPSQDSKYARDPNHPLTRLIESVAKEGGITILFVASNCGYFPPLTQCGDAAGPGKSIWGANGSPDVITVAAANVWHQYLPYSSQGPAAIDPDGEKPDICGISNFYGWPNIPMAYNGTSAATPSVAGAVALLQQAFPGKKIEPKLMREVLQSTADQICGDKPWNNYSGYGVVQADDAYKELEKKLN